MRIAVASVLALVGSAILAGLAGCSAPEAAAIEACETFVKDRLRSPSTYKKIEASAFIAVDKKEGWANVEYDAANAYGTPIREKQPCHFATPGGRWPAKDDLIQQARLAAIGGDGLCCLKDDPAAVVDNLEEAAENIGEDLDNAAVEPLED